MPTFASFPSMKSAAWLFSVVLVALFLGGCGQEDGKSIDQEKVEEATDEIEAKELELAVKVQEAPVVAESLTADEIEKLASEAGTLYEAGKYREARNKMVRAYASFGLLKEQDAATHVRYLRVLSNIWYLLQENDQTIQYATEVAIHAVDDDDRGFAYGLLGLAYHGKGDYDKAIKYYEKGLAIYLNAYGAEHPLVGVAYCNIGNAYQAKGEYDKALEYYEKDLAIDLNTRGTEHLSVATTYNNIGLTYGKKGDYDKAIEYYEKALAIILQTLDPDHPHFASSFNNIGLAYHGKGDDDKAIEYFKKALAIKLKTLGTEHPDVATTYSNIGQAYFNKGDKPKALAYLQKAKAIFLKKLGPNHPYTQNIQSGIDKVNNE